MSKKKTHEEFVKEIHDLVSGEYKVVGEYIDTMSKICIKHTLCGNQWDITPNKFLRGIRCPICMKKKQADKYRKSHEEFVKEVYDLVGNEYEVVSKYISTMEHIKIKHNCGHVWDIRPNNFLKGKRCPKCAGCLEKDTNIFKEEVFSKVKDEYTVLGEYITARIKIKMRHNTCGNKYNVTPDGFLNKNTRCPKCNEPHGERHIRNLLESLNIEYEHEKKFPDLKYQRQLRIDFYIPSLNLAIEYDGMQHFELTDFSNKMTEEEKIKQFKIIQKRDKVKNDYCKAKGIGLIRFNYKQTQDEIIEILLEKFIKKTGGT